MTADLSPEQRFVVEAVRQALVPERAASDPDDRADERLDWEAVAALAINESVAPLVYSRLKRLGSSVPDGVHACLRFAATRDAAASTIGLVVTFKRAVAALEDAGLRPVALKGTMLAYTAYRQPSQRTLSDVDLLLPKPELDRANAALLDHGFANDDPYGIADPKVNHHLQAYYLADSSVSVELHHQLISEPQPYVLDVEGLRARAEIKPVAGIDVLVPSPVDALHHLCVHLAYPHRYERAPLRSLADVLAITTRWPGELDWDLFLKIVRSARTAGAVYWPLCLGRSWLGAPVPDEVLARLAPPAPIRSVLEAFVEPDFILGRRATGEGSDVVLRAFLRDFSLYTGCSAWTQFAAFWRGLFPPPESVGHLPASVTGQPLRYAAYLWDPRRLGRGMLAGGRLVAHTASRSRASDSLSVDSTSAGRPLPIGEGKG